MHVFIAQFTYDLSEADLRATCGEIASNFAAIPGCYEKTWLIDAETNTAGGVYKFHDRDALHAYLASDLWKSVESTPVFRNFDKRIFGVMEGPTEVTHGIPTVAAVR